MNDSISNWVNTPLTVAVIISIIVLISKVSKWAGEVNSDRSMFNDFMKEIRDDIKKIFDRLPPTLIVGSSPIKLTDLGKSISDEVGARKTAQQLSSKLIERAKDKNPYEIQDLCFNYIRDEYVPDIKLLKKLQVCAYENGVDIDKILDVLAVELRDVLLEKK